MSPLQCDRGVERFLALFESLRPDLQRFAFWLCGDEALAEDFVQEALRQVGRLQDSLLHEAAVKSGLLTIVRLEYTRHVERERPVMVGITQHGSQEHSLLVAGEEPDLARLRAALFKLRQEHREPLLLQVLMGYSIEEIAAELQLSHSAVRTRLLRGRKQLRALCGEDTDQDPHG